jgi:hypothetical protein
LRTSRTQYPGSRSTRIECSGTVQRRSLVATIEQSLPIHAVEEVIDQG